MSKEKKTIHKYSRMNRDTKILNIMLVIKILQHRKEIIHHDQGGINPEMLDWFNIEKSTNEIYHINKVKQK